MSKHNPVAKAINYMFEDDGRWEADAYNAAGQRVELYINASTGAVEREKLDD